MEDAVADHDLKMKKLLRRCQEHNIKLNRQKAAFKQTEVPYIGHLLTSEGVKDLRGSKRSNTKDGEADRCNWCSPDYAHRGLPTNQSSFRDYPRSHSLSDSSPRKEQNSCGTRSMIEHSAGSKR